MVAISEKGKQPRKARLASKRKASKVSDAARRRAEANRRASADYRTRHSQDVGIEFYSRIGNGPKDKRRRKRATLSFRYFCEAYFPELFFLKWSGYHLSAIEKIEDAVLRGKLYCFAMPRGSGKTSLCRVAILWAALCGHSLYPLLVTATAHSAGRRLKSLQKILRTNDKLAEDFPEIILPIRHLQNQGNKARGQKFFGATTDLEWGADVVVFPSIDFIDLWPDEKPADVPGRWVSRATVQKRWDGIATGFGAIIDVGSMEAEIRGRSHTRNDGTEARPDLVVVDDPQTKASAKSLSMVNDREEILSADIEYMSGPDAPVGVVIPCTIIREGDLADRLLDNDLHPEYRGERSAMVEEFPDGFDSLVGPPDENDSETISLWREYRAQQLIALAKGGDGAETAFYKKHRRKMDSGFRVTWEERYSEKKGEISAVQHAMNRYFKSRSAFYAEAQNNPAGAVGDVRAVRRVTVADLLKRSNLVPRKVVPDWADCLVAFIDIGETVLWWRVVAYNKATFRHATIDFGTGPEQKTNYYTKGTLRNTLQRAHPGELFETLLSKALSRLTTRLAVDRIWLDESGDERTLDLIGIDSGWGEYATDVYRFCRRSPLRSILYATKGVGITATMRDLVDPEKKRAKGSVESVIGQWKITRTKIRTPLLQYDTNFWKTKATNLMRVTPDAPSSFAYFQADSATLRVIAEQDVSEKATRVKSRLRECDIWSLKPGRDNHFFDGLIGCHVLAHKLGARLPDAPPERSNKTKESRARAVPDPETKSRERRRRGRRIEATF